MIENGISWEKLPIEDLRLPLLQAVREDPCRGVVRAPTGSGKSTQVPQFLLDGGLARDGGVAVLEPRRLAATFLARTVARQRGGEPGGEVGYQIRFENRTGRGTRIRYVTEGVLLRELLDNPRLEGTSVVILDEFHERHLQGDIVLARVRMLQEGPRPDLKLVIMSATLDTGGLEDYLRPCRVLHTEGRTYPVEIRYCPRGTVLRSLPEQVVETVRVALAERGGEAGDVLVFLPGSHAIRQTVRLLGQQRWCAGRQMLPLYGELSPEAQDRAAGASREARIIVATNIAETSLTIPGVRVVVDSGLARMPRYDPQRAMNTLLIEPIARASADQRAGRAGRTAPGVCYRMWSQGDEAHRPAFTAPEVRRVDLSEVLLDLVAAGIDPDRFPWFEVPGEEALRAGLAVLRSVGALDEAGRITGCGRSLARFPVAPRFARMLLEGATEGVAEEACLMAALCQGRELWARPAGRGGPPERFVERGDDSDFLPLLRAWRFASACRFDRDLCEAEGIRASAARETGQLARLLERQLARSGDAGGAREPGGRELRRVILAGFADHLAVRVSAGSRVFRLASGVRAQLDRDTVLTSREQMIVACRMAEVEGKEVQVLLGLAAAVDEADLDRLFPGEVTEHGEAAWDAGGRRVVRRQVRRFRDLVIAERQAGEPGEEEAAVLLAERILAETLHLTHWDARVESWLRRVELLRAAVPELDLPPFTEEDRLLVLQEVCRGAVSYRQAKDRPVWPALQEWLSPWQRAEVERQLPERVTLENGLQLKVDYQEDPPSVSAVIQRIFDVRRLPALAGGRVPLRLKVLGPNQRPVQTTADLGGFWENSYPEIRKQLKGRYPKHEWR